MASALPARLLSRLPTCSQLLASQKKKKKNKRGRRKKKVKKRDTASQSFPRLRQSHPQ
ncbi:unnamed protein product [Ixodes persulcatus]